MLRRIGVLASLAVVAAMFMAVSSAQAQAPSDNVQCSFDGLSGQLVDPLPPASVFPVGLNQAGTYEFSGDGTCSGVVDGTTLDNDTVAIVSNGDYHNHICGTGWAFDYAADTSVTLPAGAGSPPNPDPIVVDDIGYEINFAGGEGVLQIGGKSKNPFGSVGPGQDVPGNWDGAGDVRIEAEQGTPPGCTTEAVDQFLVTGDFAAVRQ